MADDIVSLSGEGLKFGRSPANGELLIGNGSGLKLSTLTAGSNVTITNSSGGISISSTNPGGTVTSVTGTAPITSTGGATPNIALTTPVAVQYGGTGLATITSSNLMVGNGTGAVSLIAPGASGNLLTSNGTAWASTAPAPASTWTTVKKTADQTVSSGTTYVDDSALSFSMLANTTYTIRGVCFMSYATGGLALHCNGPASPTRVLGQNTALTTAAITAYSGSTYSVLSVLSGIGTGTTSQIVINFSIEVDNGVTAGTFVMRLAQTGSGGSMVCQKGSFIEYAAF
jgi:hypothetical protein